MGEIHRLRCLGHAHARVGGGQASRLRVHLGDEILWRHRCGERLDVARRAVPVKDWIGDRIVLRQRLQPEQKLHGLEHAVGVAKVVIDTGAFDPRAHNKAGRAMGIDVIHAALGVVFDDEDRGVFPDRAFADGLDDLGQAIVVVRDVTLRRVLATAGADGVIGWHADEHQVGHGCAARILGEHHLKLAVPFGESAGGIGAAIVACAEKAIFIASLLEVEFRRVAIGVIHVEASEIDVGDPFQIMSTRLKPHHGGDVVRAIRTAHTACGRGHEESVISKRNPRVLRRIPDVSIRAGNVRNRPGVLLIRRIFPKWVSLLVARRRAANGITVILAFAVESPAPVGVVIGNVPYHVRVGHPLCAPVPTVATDFATGVEVVEQHKPLGQRMLIRRDVAPEKYERRIPIALREIAQNLVVGAVLFDDVNDVRDVAGLEPNAGERILLWLLQYVQTIVLENLLRCLR